MLLFLELADQQLKLLSFKPVSEEVGLKSFSWRRSLRWSLTDWLIGHPGVALSKRQHFWEASGLRAVFRAMERFQNCKFKTWLGFKLWSLQGTCPWWRTSTSALIRLLETAWHTREGIQASIFACTSSVVIRRDAVLHHLSQVRNHYQKPSARVSEKWMNPSTRVRLLSAAPLNMHFVSIFRTKYVCHFP
jgi:hypothetical protein